MWAVQLVGSLNKVITQFKNTWGYALSVLNYRQVHGVWQAVSWSAAQVTATALATPITDGSIEITDIFFTADKATGGTATITISDGTNTETLLSVILSDSAARITHAVAGRFQGWRNGIVYYTVAGANSTGAITLGYIKHSPDSSQDYLVWNSER